MSTTPTAPDPIPTADDQILAQHDAERTATYVQVNPCMQDDDGVSRCETPEAMFFGVYVGRPGEYEWVADFVQAGHALMFATRLCGQHGYELENNT